MPKNLELTFNIEGEPQLLRRLRDVDSDFKNWTPEFQKTGQLLLKTFRDNFDSRGAELGVSWPPLSLLTLREKRRLGFTSFPLVRTGRLKKGFRSSPGKTEVVIRNIMSYFVYHQSKEPRKKIPRRIMMKIDQKRKQMITKIFQASIEDILKRRSFK